MESNPRIRACTRRFLRDLRPLIRAQVAQFLADLQLVQLCHERKLANPCSRQHHLAYVQAFNQAEMSYIDAFGRPAAQANALSKRLDRKTVCKENRRAS